MNKVVKLFHRHGCLQCEEMLSLTTKVKNVTVQTFEPLNCDGLAEITYYSISVFPVLIISDDDEKSLISFDEKFVGDAAIAKLQEIIDKGGLPDESI